MLLNVELGLPDIEIPPLRAPMTPSKPNER